ncbi:hypothetical protein Golomagni_02813 [Golovinomyces magnicellulatus]|nr:hypothetical protein Golomagni_02813 [Golovinomyces magnicellulatus]
MAGSENSILQRSPRIDSSQSPHAPEAEGSPFKVAMYRQEKELIEIIEGTIVAYRKKGTQVLLLEHWDKEAILNNDSSFATITSFAMAFVAD